VTHRTRTLIVVSSLLAVIPCVVAAQAVTNWSWGSVDRAFVWNSATQSIMGTYEADLGNDNAGSVLHVGANLNATNPNPGSIDLEAKNGYHYNLWVTPSGELHINGYPPAGSIEDTDGTVVGTQTSSRDAKNIEGRYTDYEGALNTILRTNIYSFTYKKTDYPNQKFVGLVTDEAPEFGQYPDNAHPNGRALNVVNAVGYLMAAIKAQQAEIDALRTELIAARR
jgi:hypothetical protein